MLTDWSARFVIWSPVAPLPMARNQTRIQRPHRLPAVRTHVGDDRSGATPDPIPNSEVKPGPPMILLSGKVGHCRQFGPVSGNAGGVFLVLGRRWACCIQSWLAAPLGMRPVSVCGRSRIEACLGLKLWGGLGSSAGRASAGVAEVRGRRSFDLRTWASGGRSSARWPLRAVRVREGSACSGRSEVSGDGRSV